MIKNEYGTCGDTVTRAGFFSLKPGLNVLYTVKSVVHTICMHLCRTNKQGKVHENLSTVFGLPKKSFYTVQNCQVLVRWNSFFSITEHNLRNRTFIWSFNNMDSSKMNGGLAAFGQKGISTNSVIVDMVQFEQNQNSLESALQRSDGQTIPVPVSTIAYSSPRDEVWKYSWPI